MLKIISGAQILNADRLNEGYRILESRIFANVNADNILGVLQHYILLHEDKKLFFYLELPVQADEELLEAKNIIHAGMKDIYYIDNLSTEEALTILIRDGELLINDGISSFGFGCPAAHDEIMKMKYNGICIFSSDHSLYDNFFEAHEINRCDNLVMVTDILSASNPGISSKITVEGLSVFDIPKKYEEWGMYWGERRDNDGNVIDADEEEFEGYSLRYFKRKKPGNSAIQTLGDLYNILTKCWKRETAYPSDQAYWREDVPSWGQCAITAMLVYDMFGGEIYRTPDHGHYYNKIEGRWVDLTAHQFWDFGDECDYDAGEKIERKNLGQGGHTKARYDMLKHNITEYLTGTEEKLNTNSTVETARKRAPNFSFSACNIPIGADIEYWEGDYPHYKCTVCDDNHVLYEGVRFSLSALVQKFRDNKKAVQGPKYFKYQGEYLNDIRERVQR